MAENDQSAMKHAFVGLLFFIIGIGNILAQQEDSIRIDLPHSPILYPKDSLRLNKKFTPAIPDNNNFDRYSSFYSDNTITLKLGEPKKKTNVFNAPYSRFIIPTVLVSYGILTRESDWLQELDHSTHYEVSEHITKRIHFDDYTQFAPAVAVYGLDFMGIKAKHTIRDRTFVMAASHLLVLASVQTMKNTTKIERPDGSNFHSFPSGHTATAFIGAHMLFKEYANTSPWIAIAGYVVASGTGIMRIYNRKHWISDVVTGAGIGILSVEVSYLLLPVFHNILGIKDSKKNLVVTPVISSNNYGVGLAYTF